MHLIPRASGSFMMSIMTRFLTTGSSLIMSVSSCARAPEVMYEKCMSRKWRDWDPSRLTASCLRLSGHNHNNHTSYHAGRHGDITGQEADMRK